MPVQRIRTLLEKEHVLYEVMPHPTAFTAQETAQRLHTPGREFAKVIMVEADGRYVMTVLPAHLHVDLGRLRTVLGARSVALARETSFLALFPDCEVGAEPPFGNVYDLPVFVDDSLLADEFITFNAGTHNEAIRMPFAEFDRIVAPRYGSFGITPVRRESAAEADAPF